MANNSLYVYETVYAFNLITGEMDPVLAEKYEWIENDMVLRLTLHEGTRWQDGEPLTAEDVEYTLKLGKKYSQLLPWWNYVLDVRAVDDRTVDIILDPGNPTVPW